MALLNDGREFSRSVLRLMPLWLCGLITLSASMAAASCHGESEPARYPALESAAPPQPPSPAAPKNLDEIPVYTYKVIHTYPHDPLAFTQGLVFADAALYESTGLRGESTLRRVDLQTGKPLQVRELSALHFGEGLVVYGNRIVQLTWTSNIGFVYDKRSFELLRTFRYPNEGWGITHDGTRLIMSDGSATLTFWDPETFEEIGSIVVRAGGRPVTSLNELEYIKGEIYANIWQSDVIARISPETGEVVAWVDLTGILSAQDRWQGVDVLNGIAYDVGSERLFVTGKRWPKLFEIELVPVQR
jgi:glutamine cyclotransferase